MEETVVPPATVSTFLFWLHLPFGLLKYAYGSWSVVVLCTEMYGFPLTMLRNFLLTIVLDTALFLGGYLVWTTRVNPRPTTGSSVKDGAKFCAGCGTPIGELQPA